MEKTFSFSFDMENHCVSHKFCRFFSFYIVFLDRLCYNKKDSLLCCCILWKNASANAKWKGMKSMPITELLRQNAEKVCK